MAIRSPLQELHTETNCRKYGLPRRCAPRNDNAGAAIRRKRRGWRSWRGKFEVRSFFYAALSLRGLKGRGNPFPFAGTAYSS